MARTPGYFKDKTIIITGGGSGIGRATAVIFAREGAKVVIGDINEAGGKEVVEAVKKEGSDAIFVPCDVTKREQVKNLVAKAVEKFGKVHFLFNSAGSALKRCTFLEADDALWDLSFDLNVKGTYYATQEVLPHMLENGKGVIINVASMAHKRGGPGTSVHYAAAKGAVHTMTLGVAREFADRGIRCLSVSPGPVNTNFQAASGTTPEMAEKFAKDIPMKRIAEADEVAELVLFMCSDACEFMTADTVYLSGGGGWK
ncbi:short chain dehydrogenase [Agaricicola taiwanensis]|uniref:Short chain dehydrogenase n=1 Tax=Agaricicola taiwanensis TaxID=591372 RepID=A0A8J3E0L0_9RHOB|nr:SDR family oxidoreductase [Agaricicola taiwanensis]GGE51457.1 short chain dehydrogenase [Agaricicola taiwanensis]